MSKAFSIRWLAVAASAAMLLILAAACGAETIEVPGETVVVKEEVVRTVEVPGETVVKEVVKEVQVPGPQVRKVSQLRRYASRSVANGELPVRVPAGDLVGECIAVFVGSRNGADRECPVGQGRAHSRWRGSPAVLDVQGRQVVGCHIRKGWGYAAGEAVA